MKKSLFSRILSIGLVLCMAVAMLPTVFAADAGYTIVYDFISNYQDGVPYTSGENNFFTHKGLNEVSTYEKSNGFWKFDAMEGSLSVNHCYNPSTPANNGLRAYCGAGHTWFSIKINVPVSDTYDVILGYDSNEKFDPACQIYILDGNATADDIAANISVGTNLIGSVNCTNGKQDGTQKTTVGSKELSAGEHTVVFHASTEKELRLHSFSLSSGAGTVAMSATAGASKTSLDPSLSGDSALVSVSSVMYSDTTSKTDGIEATDFAYISRDTSRATVDANGVVTVNPAAPDGEVSVDVVLKENNSFVLDTVVFTVAASECSDAKFVYDFKTNYSSDIPYTEAEKGFFTASTNLVDTYEKTNGFWKFALLDGSVWVNREYSESNHANDGYIIYWSGEWFAIKIRVPVSDIYKTSVGYNANNKFEKNLEVYLLDGDADNAAVAESIANGENKLGTVDCTTGKEDGTQKKTLSSVKLDAGEYLVVFRAPSKTYLRLYEFALTAGDGSRTVPMSAEISASDVEVGKTSDISLDKVYLSDATTSTSADGITYESSDSSVLLVSGNTAAGKKAGKADIYAKYNGETIGKTSVSVSEAAVSDKVSFAVTATNDAEISVNGISYNGAVDSVVPGSLVTVTAPEVQGYKFRYWKSGYQNGRYVSSEPEYSFRLVTHTFLTAVYDKENTDSPQVEFFNGNGAFIETVNVAKGALFGDNKIANPSLTGFAFTGWSLEDSYVINGDTRAVALYNEIGKSVGGAVKVNGVPVENPTYDKKVEITVPGATCWKRDGKVVAFGESYTHYIWDATEITSSDEAIEKTPIVVLENTTVDGAYMIEYDAAGYEIVEAGIVFGADDATVGSCTSKATSQKNASHGQFTAKPSGSESAARGYIIYKDGSTNRVVYSK